MSLQSIFSAVRNALIWPITSSLTSLSSEADRTSLLLSSMYHHFAIHGMARYTQGERLQRFGYKAFSQNDEDGILEEIFRRIGTTSRFFVEFGVENGVENNTRLLLLKSWSGVWLERDARHTAEIRERFAEFLTSGTLKVQQAMITAENIEELFEQLSVPKEFDLLNIDIDGNDYWIWQAVTRFSPRVVVIEYNATFGPEADYVIPYRPDHVWDRTSRFGASLKALERLATQKGYRLVGCNFKGVNAFFVRSDLAERAFPAPHTAEYHWEPARGFLRFYSGHTNDWTIGRPEGPR